MKKYKIIALFGEAGAGKDRVLRTLIDWDQSSLTPQYNEIVSCTTRPKREGEVDGVNYHFLTLKEFQDQAERGDMLETAEFRKWFYGTSLSALDAEKVNIGVFNPTGIRSLLKDPRVDTKVYKIAAPAKTRLLRQLNRENNPDVDEIVRRYQTDCADFQNIDFEYEELCNEKSGDLMNIVGQFVRGEFGQF